MNALQKTVLGFQHTLAMFGATVLVPLMTGLNVSVALFSAGVGTLIFHLVTKRKVPVFLGSSFAFIPLIQLVGAKFGLPYALGGIIAAGALYIVLAGLVALFGADTIRSFFPPVVVGPIIMVIGLVLSPVALGMAAENWLVALIALGTIIVVSVLGTGFIRIIPIICGIATGYLAAIAVGLVDFQAIANAQLFAVPEFMAPKFSLEAIAIIAPIALVTMVEHFGDINANGAVVGQDFMKDPGLHRTLLGDGIATMVAGFVGGPANTTYSENTGVLAITRVYDPAILRIAAAMAIGLSFIGKFGAAVSTIPGPVMGGVSIMLFGMIAGIGVKTVTENQVDFSNPRNLVIASSILVIGIAAVLGKDNPVVVNLTESIQLSGMGLAVIVGILLHKLLPEKLTERLANTSEPIKSPLRPAEGLSRE